MPSAQVDTLQWLLQLVIQVGVPAALLTWVAVKWLPRASDRMAKAVEAQAKAALESNKAYAEAVSAQALAFAGAITAQSNAFGGAMERQTKAYEDNCRYEREACDRRHHDLLERLERASDVAATRHGENRQDMKDIRHNIKDQEHAIATHHALVDQALQITGRRVPEEK